MKGHCIIGGTFTYVHAGHQELLLKAKRFSKITIGLTSDYYVREHKLYPSFPYAKRLKGLRSALKRHGILHKTEVKKIDDDVGFAGKHSFADTIIVSEETERAAKWINEKRGKAGMQPLRIISVPLVFAENLKKISCAGIYDGKIDSQGKLESPIVFQAGTDNPTKLKGATDGLRRIFGKRIIVRGHRENSNVSMHPFNRETFTGARNRAHAAWKRAKGSSGKVGGVRARGNSGRGSANGKCDYSIGMESGLFCLDEKTHMDITVCCVYDGEKESFGTSMGFLIPEYIVERIQRNRIDLSMAMEEIAGIEKIGRKEGALGYFSANALKRQQQVESCVSCAFVPRIARAKRRIEY